VAEWANVWLAVKLPQDPDQIDDLVTQAESASIVQGRDEAAALGRSPSLGEVLALTASDTFRVSQRNRGLTRDLATLACGISCVVGRALGVNPADAAVDTVVDERDFAAAFAGASTAFSQNRNPVLFPAQLFFPGQLFNDFYPRWK
jgi:hypothetical protein